MCIHLVSNRLKSLLQCEKLEYNPEQQRVAYYFDRLLIDLYRQNNIHKWGFLSRLWDRWRGNNHFIKGIYLCGDVGQGKSMIMNIFFSLACLDKKCKLHFHEFMKDVHSQIAIHRKNIESGESPKYDPIPLVADSIALKATLLCFDEFMVTNIVDAVILSRIFTELFARGCILVATSNVIPEDLYKDGINGDFFIPFIDLLKTKVEVISLDSGHDYRRKKRLILPIYMTPLNSYTSKNMNQLWKYIIADNSSVPLDILSKGGYNIHVPASAGKVSRFSFFDLCDKPLAASDFMEIARRFDIVFIDNVPIFKGDHRDWIRRFIMIIDVFYENKICLIMSSETDIESFFIHVVLGDVECKRAVSRLFEMFSEKYVSNHKIVMDACKIFLSR
ncbi:MAG: cell division protein ZapE [Candidatus Liberibacter europaeus]|uniref:Cell division protein ZapE n=1 Tax=Candidatus Liberibacter europaeus TaxID=744859 RepID=A0A2T4VW88_9HYPH|nr:cell division protein ZapE [Candidatus Liberibacter europaeus]PTL86039.1 MAG: cell division protein ZapE [Candidatus Liberibacter europaeus]